MQIRIYVDENRAGAVFSRYGEKSKDALRGAANDAADEILARGQDDIESAGNFGDRWTEGLHVNVTEGGGNIKVSMTHDIPYWTVFEFGAVIHGNPLLWIPFSFADDAKGLWPRAYGPLFRVDRKSDGLPILFAWSPGGRGGKAEPKYFGKEQVVEPKKFHLREIAREVAKELPGYFKERFKD